MEIDDNVEHRLVILRDDWALTDIRPGDVINVLGLFSPIVPSTSSMTLCITISSKSNLLILHPDLLFTATALSDATQCRRKPLLSSLVRSSSDTTPALVWGNMLHEVMQSCFIAGRWEESWIDEKIDHVIRKGLDHLLKIDFPVEQAKREVAARAKGLIAFAQKYVSDSPKVTPPTTVLSETIF